MKRTLTCIAYAFLFALFLSPATHSFSAAQESSQEQEQQLIAVLQSDAPAAQKAITCKRLAIHGSSQSVPALAPLLGDEQLSSWARIALEAIPGPEADAALRQAATSTSGRLLIGVINSIGVRADAQAVELLSQRLQDQDPQVASAAAVALGHIDDPAATQALRQALAAAPAEVRSAVAEGCILCAERLWAAGQAEEAARIYDEVREAELPKPRVLEATRGAILARGAAGTDLLLEQLRSPDKARFQIGLTTARELSSPEVIQALANELQTAPAERGALLLLALSERTDAVASPAIVQAAKSGSKPVRIAAIRVLERLGNADTVPTLLAIASGDDADLSQAATTALVNLPGDKVNAEIASRLPQADATMLPLLIQLVGQRRIAATNALRQAVDRSEPEIRAAALTALGETVGLDEIDLLIARVTSPKFPEDRATAQQALRAACVRMPQREECAQQLIVAMARCPVAQQSNLLETLAAMGGEKALQAMHEAAKGRESQLQDTATRLLGEWMTVDAGPVLLDLAQTSTDNRFKIRAVRGYIRLARQFTMPDSQRAEMCREALKVAQRPADKKLVLEVLQRYPSLPTLEVAVSAAQGGGELKQEAMLAALQIAQKTKADPIVVQRLLTRLGQEPVKVEIVKAQYGAGDQQKDVTETLRKHVRDLPLIALPSSSYNACFGGDPVPGTVKRLTIQYRIDGRPGEATFAEDAVIILPSPR